MDQKRSLTEHKIMDTAHGLGIPNVQIGNPHDVWFNREVLKVRLGDGERWSDWFEVSWECAHSQDRLTELLQEQALNSFEE